jgi:hypothetical protein
VTTRLCEAPPPCTAADPQPSVCGPGLYCVAGSCLELPRPSCDNFGSQAAPRRYDAITDLGPVLTGARAVSFLLDDGGCPAGSLRRGIVELEAHDRLSRFGLDGGLPRLFVYRPNMTLGTVPASDVTTTVGPQGGTARLRVATCTSESVTNLTLGYAFEGGNGLCVTLMP